MNPRCIAPHRSAFAHGNNLTRRLEGSANHQAEFISFGSKGVCVLPLHQMPGQDLWTRRAGA